MTHKTLGASNKKAVIRKRTINVNTENINAYFVIYLDALFVIKPTLKWSTMVTDIFVLNVGIS